MALASASSMGVHDLSGEIEIEIGTKQYDLSNKFFISAVSFINRKHDSDRPMLQAEGRFGARSVSGKLRSPWPRLL